MEKFYNFLARFFDFWPAATEYEKGFRNAMLLSAMVFLLLVIIGLILKLIFRRPAVSGVVLEREDGDIFISRSAIYTAVCRLESEFPEFEIMKVIMQRNHHRELELTVTVLFEEQDKAFDAAAAELKQRVFTMLNKSFGIEDVKSVAIILSKIPGGHDTDGEDDVPVVHNGFVTGI